LGQSYLDLNMRSSFNLVKSAFASGQPITPFAYDPRPLRQVFAGGPIIPML
jgi:hypothetical protein